MNLCYINLYLQNMQLQKAKAILQNRDTQAQAVAWAALMIPKLTHGCTQKTKYQKRKKKHQEKMRSKEMEQKTVVQGDF